MITADMQDRLDMMAACGYPIFIIGSMVVMPAEADEIFTPEELEILEAHIRANLEAKESVDKV